MNELVAAAFLSVVFTKVFEQLASLMVKLGTNSEGLKLKMLEEKLNKVNPYLHDAEDRQLSDKKVKEWLDDFKDVIFIVDDLLEHINNFKENKRAASWILSLYHSFAKKGENDFLLKKLDDLRERAGNLELKHVSTSTIQNRRSFQTIVAPLRDERHVYGREAEKEEILKMLKLSDEDQMIVLPIVGMGGLGKTTLAQLVYNDKQVEEHGFLKAWVSSSSEFDFCRIIKVVLQKVNPGTSCSEVNDADELQQLMKKELTGKRFLFVIDDVWDRSYWIWDSLRSIFEAGDRSRVIVTTRSRVVGSRVKMGPIYELKEVQTGYCLSIFAHHAFKGDTNPHPSLHELGGRLVEKCKGLPLALACLGGRLYSERNPQKWQNILQSDLGDWSEVMEEEVFPRLWLSYRYLSLRLKPCFAYCSLFPKDYKFRKKEMVLWWMGEGFLPPNEKGKSMEDIGEEWFDDLVSSSLFKRSSEGDDTYVVHDLVHGVAAFVNDKFCWRTGDDLKRITIRTRHLTYNGDVSSGLRTSLSTSKHLRTLMNIQASPTSDFVDKMAKEVRCLRVITISLPRSVLCHSLGDLKMLRYLNLSGSEIEELPDSICSLFHLQTLILIRCYGITQLPKDLPMKLSKLRYLGTISTGLTKMPTNMGSLKELRTLANFVVGREDGSGCSSLAELGELHHLDGLIISNLENVENLEHVKNASLRDKAEMKKLLLSWGGNSRRKTIQAVNVLGALQPHNNLEKLEVHNYPGSKFPKWVGEMSFSKMASVRLNGTFNHLCCLLPPLGQLPSLRELCIECFKGVEKIGNEFLYENDNSSTDHVFRCLESLSFNDMKRWKDWSFDRKKGVCFPRLRILKFSACRNLKFIIRKQDFPKLEQLSISQSPLLERSYQKDTGEHWGHISHIAHIYVGDTTDKLKREEEERRQREERRRQGEEKSESHIPEIHKTSPTTIVKLTDELECKKEDQSESRIREMHETDSAIIVESSDVLAWEEEEMRQDEEQSEIHKTGSTITLNFNEKKRKRDSSFSNS